MNAVVRRTWEGLAGETDALLVDEAPLRLAPPPGFSLMLSTFLGDSPAGKNVIVVALKDRPGRDRTLVLMRGARASA